MARDTSISAYENLKQSGKRIPQWMKIFHAVNRSKYGLTRSEIECNTGL